MKKAHEHIEELAARLRGVPDEQLLAELNELPGLPNESAEDWKSEQTWLLAYRLMAIGDVAGERRLRAAIVPMLERASYGDPGEMMRGLRHTLEAIVNPDWAYLAAAYSTAATSRKPGARLWSIFGLGVLRDPGTISVLVKALRDPALEVRKEACSALTMLCQDHPTLRDPALRALETCYSEPDIGVTAREAAQDIMAIR